MEERGHKGKFSRRKRYTLKGVEKINPDDYEFLNNFVTPHGKILPARLTGANSKQQRQIKRAVRRARVVGMIP